MNMRQFLDRHYQLWCEAIDDDSRPYGAVLCGVLFAAAVVVWMAVAR